MDEPGDDGIDNDFDREIEEIAPIECQCFACDHREFEIYARFEYSNSLFQNSYFSGRQQEYFTWFSGLGKCRKCSTMNLLIDFECD